MTERRLTLVAAYDDIVRNSAILTQGLESEFLRFVQNQEECRLKWLEAEEELRHVKGETKRLKSENTALETKLKHARGQIDIEMKRRTKAEHERERLERQVCLVRELLTDKNGTPLNDKDRERLAFLSFQPDNYESPKRQPLQTINESGSLLSPSDISFDKTGEDGLDVVYPPSSKKRPSAPPLEDILDVTPPEKRHRSGRKSRSKKKSKNHRRSNSAIVTLTTVTVDPEGPIEATTEIDAEKLRPRRNSSPGKGNINKYKENWNNNARDCSPGGSPVLLGKGLNRQHVFVSKTVIKPETCMPCSKRIRFGKIAMKCKDCRATAHPECKERVPLPCIPTMSTPGSNKVTGYSLSDFVTTDPPMIPALVVHCVNEVEAKGLSEVGLYRISGSEKEVKDLKEKFMRGRGAPNLSNVNDIHVVCGCMKDFLRGLKEPLVTRTLWRDFVIASEMHDRDECFSSLYQAVSQLPQPNRDTLAFLICHLQRIAEVPECKMPASNLAKVFGPTVVGYSSADPEPMQMINETKKQALVMERLLMIPSDYWTSFMLLEDDQTYAQDAMTPQTPEPRQVPRSMLGPVFSPGMPSEERKSFFSRTTTNTPRYNTRSHQTGNRTNFFQSPMLH